MPKRNNITSTPGVRLSEEEVRGSEEGVPYIGGPRPEELQSDGAPLRVLTCNLTIPAMLTAISWRDTEESEEEKFNRLADKWEEETRFLSSIGDIVTHKAHLRIMAMGREAIPLILNRMRHKPGMWFDALAFLTRDDPVTDDIRGDFDAMTTAWLGWGERNGYCRPAGT